jgi:hypothetical protein
VVIQGFAVPGGASAMGAFASNALAGFSIVQSGGIVVAVPGDDLSVELALDISQYRHHLKYNGPSREAACLCSL